MLLKEKTIKLPKIQPKLPKKNYAKYLLFALLLLGIYFALKYAFEENVEVKDGKFVLKSKRVEQFQKDSATYEMCEQYVLLTLNKGFYPCYSCVGTDSVYLLAGEVCKYGVHCPKNDRYSVTWLAKMKLEYKPQFLGDIKKCLIAEKFQIIHYPLLPENLKRIKLLGHPPGNKNDR